MIWKKFLPERRSPIACLIIMLNLWSVLKINTSHYTVSSMLHEDNWKLIPRIKTIYNLFKIPMLDYALTHNKITNIINIWKLDNKKKTKNKNKNT